MKIHLVDGTYELFRAHFGAPPKQAPDGREVGATLGLLRSLMLLLSDPEVTHVAVAFDHVIELFRNEMYAGYKTGAGVDPNLLAQFPLAEKAVSALGLVIWPMVKFEADDAIATAVARFKVKSVKQIVICSVDKDLTQLVDGDRVVCWDRRREIILDEKGVIGKFGVSPESIPDYLALVGDAADGYPGIKGWGAASTSTVLSRFKHIEFNSLRPEATRPGSWTRNDSARKPEKELQRCLVVQGVIHAAQGCPDQRDFEGFAVAGRLSAFEEVVSRVGG